MSGTGVLVPDLFFKNKEILLDKINASSYVLSFVV